VTQRTEASLRSPGSGFAVSTISSGFGAPRDGGARDHHGIDIFRPRGTPVVAAADGVVSLDETPRGGRVVWLRDARMRRNIYYAHLDNWAVTSGALVRAGDVLGYIGNTSNARTTPPHRHFGVYERGPTDPVPYLRRDDPAPPIVTAREAPERPKVMQSGHGGWSQKRRTHTLNRQCCGTSVGSPRHPKIRLITVKAVPGVGIVPEGRRPSAWESNPHGPFEIPEPVVAALVSGPDRVSSRR
jgi:hypothetical protein